MKPNARPDGFRHLVRGLFVKRPYADAADLHGKTAIVTGASPMSIGCDTARILASFGATVIITTGGIGDGLKFLSFKMRAEELFCDRRGEAR